MSWDIMGQPSFLEILREAYFRDAQAVLAVSDVTRREALDHLPAWIDAVVRTVKSVPVVITANKADLVADSAYGQADAVRAAETFGAEVLVTSAKTGANAEAAFRRLATRLLERPIETAVFFYRFTYSHSGGYYGQFHQAIRS